LFYVDECIPLRFCRDLFPRIFEIAQIVEKKYPATVKSVVEEFGSSAQDMLWVPSVAKELRGNGGLILTGDKGRKKRGDKLPELCEVNNVKYVIVSSTVRVGGIGAMAILACWDKLYTAATESSDTLHYQIEAHKIGGKDEVGEYRYRVCRKS